MSRRTSAELLEDELEARGWTTHDLAERMGGDVELNHCTIEFLLAVDDPRMILDETVAVGLGRALGTSPEFWVEIDKRWREAARTAAAGDDDE